MNTNADVVVADAVVLAMAGSCGFTPKPKTEDDVDAALGNPVVMLLEEVELALNWKVTLLGAVVLGSSVLN